MEVLRKGDGVDEKKKIKIGDGASSHSDARNMVYSLSMHARTTLPQIGMVLSQCNGDDHEQGMSPRPRRLYS